MWGDITQAGNAEIVQKAREIARFLAFNCRR